MSVEHLLQTSLAVSALIALVLILRGPVARRFGAHAAYALWFIPAARMLMPPIPESWSPLAALSGGFTGRATAAGPQPSLVTIAAPAEPAPGLAPVMPAEPANALVPEIGAALPWGALLVGLYLAGVAGMLAWTAWRQARFAWLARIESAAPSRALEAEAAGVGRALGLSRPVAVRTSFLSPSPLVMGLRRPVILVPAWFEHDYTDEERRLALSHEMAHVKRGDLIALQAAYVLLALQWFNPLAHLALRAFRADQEAACDAEVLARGASPQAYGRTLLKAVKTAAPRPRLQAAGLTLDHGLKERFRRMGRASEGRPAGRAARLGLTAAGAALLIASASTFADEPEGLLGGDDAQTRSLTQLEVDGRRMVIFGDPFEGLDRALDELMADMPEPPHPPLPPQPPMPDGFALSLHLDLDELGELEGLIELSDLHKLSELAALEALADAEITVTPLEAGKGFRIEGNGLNMVFTGTGFDAEALAARLGDIEAHMDAYREQVDAWGEAIEARAEAMAERVELRIERRHHSRINAARRASHDVVERLTAACAGAREAGDTPKVVTVEAAEEGGQSYRAICLDRRDDIDDADLDAFIEASPDLTKADREAWVSRRTAED